VTLKFGPEITQGHLNRFDPPPMTSYWPYIATISLSPI